MLRAAIRLSWCCCLAMQVTKRHEGEISTLHTVDDLSHPGQTADRVMEAAEKLGSEEHLTLHVKVSEREMRAGGGGMRMNSYYVFFYKSSSIHGCAFVRTRGVSPIS